MFARPSVAVSTATYKARKAKVASSCLFYVGHRASIFHMIFSAVVIASEMHVSGGLDPRTALSNAWELSCDAVSSRPC